MGSDKALLSYRGRSLLDHMLDLLGQAGLTDCLVSGVRDGYPCVPDRMTAAGPLGALYSLADTLSDRTLVIVAVDMPQLTPQWLRQLMAAPADLRCVHFRSAPLPLRLRTDAVTRACLRASLDHPEPGQRSLRVALLALHATPLPWPAGAKGRELESANTPADWWSLIQPSDPSET
jgi:molybdopterin-guanine dinucleotide biosynthesis protein A